MIKILFEKVVEVLLINRGHDLVIPHVNDKIIDVLIDLFSQGHYKYFGTNIIAKRIENERVDASQVNL